MIEIIAHMHPDVESGKVMTRLKHLQRLSFPAVGDGVGRGWRMEYPVDDLMRFVAVFELLAAGVAPQLAARFVTEQWDDLSWGLAFGYSQRDRADAELLLATSLDGLDAGMREGGSLWLGEPAGLGSALFAAAPGRRTVVVDLVATARALASSLSVTGRSARIVAFTKDVYSWARWRINAKAPNIPGLPDRTGVVFTVLAEGGGPVDQAKGVSGRRQVSQEPGRGGRRGVQPWGANDVDKPGGEAV